MSILNKMHKELQQSADEPHLLEVAPTKRRKQKILLFTFIILLLLSSLGLSYLIYNDGQEEATAVNEPVIQIVTSEPKPQVVSETIKPVVMEVNPVIAPTIVPMPPVIVEDTTPVIHSVAKAVTVPAITVTPAPMSDAQVRSKTAPNLTPTTKPKQPNVKKILPVEKSVKSGHLEIKKSNLTPSQRADIHIKKSKKALAKDDLELAAKEKSKALSIKPDLHEVRKSLALYYYGLGEQNRANNVLKKGAQAYPEYADFNLMLSRIALKNGDQQRAYLYLQQFPPEVEANLDYHVSYAILAQKFEDYPQSEILYQGLLTQRPNNGRWMMSLAIAQDKQGKESLAVKNYQKALLQIDLSSNAKKYINQRLTYLATH